MSRLVVLTTPDLADGYRLGGATTLTAGSSQQAQEILQGLLSSETGVIAVHAPYFDGFDRLLRRRLDSVSTPLVVPLPAGGTAEQSDERRERLVELLRQAIGYEITFDHEGSRS